MLDLYSNMVFTRSLRLSLLSVTLLCWLAIEVHAVPTAAGQKAVLYQMRSEAPLIENLEMLPWSNTAIENACDTYQLAGVVSCNSSGWVTEMSFQFLPLGLFPPSLGDNEALISFTSVNTWEGGFPASLGNLRNLETFHFSGSALEGQVPEEWKNLKKLKTFILVAINVFAGGNAAFQVPSWIGDEWPLLEEFIWNCGTNSAVPAWIGTFPIVWLDISQNEFYGAIPGGITGNAALKTADFSRNAITSVPSDWSGATSLTALYLSSNELGNLPTVIPTSLLYLSAAHNPIRSSIPQALMESTGLIDLDLDDAELTGDLPWPSSPSTSRFRVLKFRDNPELTGNISSTLWQIPYLYYFLLGNTQVTGPLPAGGPSPCNLIGFEVFNSPIGGSLSSNFLEGCVESLVTLNLKGSELTGAIPDTVAMMSASKIDLSSNQFEGPLPEDWSNSLGLEELRLNHNSINGSVPASLIALSTSRVLSKLYLNNNKLDLCDTTLISSSFALSSCDVSAQNPEPCGCSGIWSSCLSVDIAACPIIPIEEPFSEPLSADPISSPSSEPSSQTPSSQTPSSQSPSSQSPSSQSPSEEPTSSAQSTGAITYAAALLIILAVVLTM
jgi:hypothetical protein